MEMATTSLERQSAVRRLKMAGWAKRRVMWFKCVVLGPSIISLGGVYAIEALTCRSTRAVGGFVSSRLVAILAQALALPVVFLCAQGAFDEG